MIECIGDGATEFLGRVVASQPSSASHYIKKVEVREDGVHFTVSKRPAEALLEAMFATVHNDDADRTCFVHLLDASDEPDDDVPSPAVTCNGWSRGIIAETICGRVEAYTTDGDSGSVLHKVVVTDYEVRTAFVISFGAEWKCFKHVLSRVMALIPE